MNLPYQFANKELIVPMPKEVDHHMAKHLSQELDFLIDSWQVRRLVFDFAQTDFMDSSGIGILIGRKRIMDLYCGEIYAVNLSGRVEQIFEKSGLSRIICTERRENV